MRTSLAFLVVLAGASAASARPTGPGYFCDTYADTSTCAGRGTTCLTCHTSTSPEAPDWNDFGYAIIEQLGLAEVDFDEPGAVRTALQAIEGNDSDADGLTNLEEIVLGTLPGDGRSFFTAPPPGVGDPNPSYDVGTWDPKFALRRAVTAYCGRSPRIDELEATASRDDVHEKLDECLQSPFWLGEGLSRLADEKIRPIDLSVSFLWDYRLWRYVMTGDRDVRDVLLADYYVREASPNVLTEVQDVVNDANACTADSECAFDHVCRAEAPRICLYASQGQALPQSERAGMLGTVWFHFINTMFSAMPRTTAAHAMRSYLGMDIARQQGIAPIVDEPLDVDAKGVQQEECAQCHSTLDPATYVFAKYRGIEGGGPPSAFDPNRPIGLGLWTPSTEPQGMLLGQPVSTLRDWAQVAAASDEFKHNMARLLFEHALGRPPGPQDKEEFDALWPSWSSIEVGYNANEFIHKLVDTDAFGAP